ncbi:MAG: hypothetical protein KKC99_07460 [Proteobacteria bacterium]|nr:hypothetical protein [Pseudomonadota bacterium]
MEATARQTKNMSYRAPDGPRSRKIWNSALLIKEVIERIVDHPAAVEELTHVANVLIAESELVAEMESTALLQRFCVFIAPVHRN